MCAYRVPAVHSNADRKSKPAVAWHHRKPASRNVRLTLGNPLSSLDQPMETVMKQLFVLSAAALSMFTLTAGADPEKRNTIIRKPAASQVMPGEVTQPHADDRIVVAERDKETKDVPNGPWKPRKD
jgi:hypothetical protein